ncbi:MAG: phosphopyruvate hydratase [Candidatus Anammoxibacter sp.]
MSKIVKIIARKIYDASSNPTVEIEVRSEGGASAVSSAPKSLYNPKEHIRYYSTNFYGKNILDVSIGEMYKEGVDKTIESLERIVIPEIVSNNVNNQAGIDSKLDTLIKLHHKEGFNSTVNATFAISSAVAKAAAQTNKMSLFKYIRGLFIKNRRFDMPIPMINIFDGGIYTNNNLVCQSLMIVPIGAKSFKESIRIGAEVFHTAKKVLHANKLSSSVGDHGGYAPIFGLNDDPNVVNWDSIIKEALDLIIKSIEEAGYKPGTDVSIAIDMAAGSSFYDEWFSYGLTGSDGKSVEIRQKEIIYFLSKTVEEYPVTFIGDGLADNDEKGWQELNKKIGKDVHVSGGGIFFNQDSDKENMFRGGVANSAMISLDRFATLSEVFEAINFAQRGRLNNVIYNGLGDTEDVIIADIAVGCNVDMIKAGGFCRTERIARYNQLLRIEEELGENTSFKPKRLAISQ